MVKRRINGYMCISLLMVGRCIVQGVSMGVIGLHLILVSRGVINFFEL